MSLTEGMGLAHAGRKLNIILAQLCEHSGCRHIYGIIVQNVLKLLNMPDRLQGRTSDLAHPFGNRVECCENLLTLFVENQMIVSKVRPRSVPAEVLGLKVQREHVGK